MTSADDIPDFDTARSTLPAYLRDSTHFVPTPPQFRITQRFGNALYFTPCPDFPDTTSSRTLAMHNLDTLRAWHALQGHGVTNTEAGFVAKLEGRFVAEYACHATAYQVKAQP